MLPKKLKPATPRSQVKHSTTEPLRSHLHIQYSDFFPTILISIFLSMGLGRVAQSVTCLATDASLTADPGVASSIPAWSHTFMEIGHEIISTVILLPSADSFKKCCCQLQARVCARITG